MRAVVVAMELNVCPRGEPSHIHIRRPSRDQIDHLAVEAPEREPEPASTPQADQRLR